MFNSKKKEQKLLEHIAMIKPTSKAALKQQCLYLSHLDVDKAQKMYDFLIKDMEDIPSIDAAQKSFIENFGEQANGVIGWLRNNEDMLGKTVDFVKGVIASRKGNAVTPLPPINN